MWVLKNAGPASRLIKELCDDVQGLSLLKLMTKLLKFWQVAGRELMCTATCFWSYRHGAGGIARGRQNCHRLEDGNGMLGRLQGLRSFVMNHTRDGAIFGRFHDKAA